MVPHPISFLFFVVLSFYGVAQTVNTGELYISPGTEVGVLTNFDNSSTAIFDNNGDLYVYAGFNNDGLVTFSGNAGLTRFVGNSTQLISGSEPSDFYDVLISNFSAQPAIHLSSVINIANEGEFEQGVINAEDFQGLVVFGQNAAHSTVSDESHVDGQVAKIGNEPFEFPIGDNGFFRPAGISAPTINTNRYTAQYKLENSDALYPHGNRMDNIELIDDAEYWEINHTDGPPNILITLSWDTRTTPTELLEDGSDFVHVVRWDNDQGIWVNEGGTVDEANNTVTTVANVSDTGIFTLAKSNDLGVLTPELIIPNGFSPNNDGINDVFEISALSSFPNFKIEIYNRWGSMVYEYHNNGRAEPLWWDGFSTGPRTVNKKEKVPAGTYFYSIEFGNEGIKPITGWVYVNK